MALTFQADTHQYFLNGRELPSVTTMLKNVGLIDTRFMPDDAADVGRRRHLLCQYMDEGILDWGSVLEEDMPYAVAWGAFREEHEFDVEGTEVQTYNEIYQYAGTIDRIGKYKGEPAIVDIKTGTKQKWHGLQLLLYAMMVAYDNDGEAIQPRLFDVYLKDTSKYQLIEHPYTDLEVAKSVLRLHHWKEKK